MDVPSKHIPSAAIVTLFILPLVILFWQDRQSTAYIYWQLTLPSLVTAAVVGAALAAASACLQVLLRNPLADPGIIGITSGASLMATVVFTTSLLPLAWSQWWLSLVCFIGALCSTGLILWFAKRLPGFTVAIILAGILVSTIASALMAWLYIFAEPQALRQLTFWLMGSFSYQQGPTLLVLTPIALTLMVWLCRQAPLLNLLYFGGQFAQLKGINVPRKRIQIIVVVALLVGLSVSMAGSIAFVGLLVPHWVRLRYGYDNQQVISLSAMVGALLMLLIVNIHVLLANVELPISLLTASIGGPLFLWLLFKTPTTLGDTK